MYSKKENKMYDFFNSLLKLTLHLGVSHYMASYKHLQIGGYYYKKIYVFLVSETVNKKNNYSTF